MTRSLGKKILYAALFAALFCALAGGVWMLRASSRYSTTASSEVGDPLGFSLLTLLYRMTATPASAGFVPPLQGRAALADLPSRSITLFENGTEIAKIPIISIGKPGTAWETPAGSYEILTKEDLHFSSLGNVWMPYSMHFFGNFFVHGWPYYPDGTPVGTGYSGGCIRLKTEDARVLYEFVDIGTPIHVLGGEGVRERTPDGSSAYYLTKGGDRPTVSASAYAVTDAETGALLFARDVNTEHSAESVARLMAALAAVEVVNQFAPLNIAFLSGDTDTVLGDDAIALLLEGNTSAIEVFRARAGAKRFDAAMAGKARAMGLAQSTFGSGPLVATTTPKDMSIFARYLYRNKQYFFKKTSVPEEEITGARGLVHTVVYPTVTLGENSVYRGGVIGNSSGDALVLMDLPLSEFEKRPIVVSLLDSKDPARDVEALAEFTKSHFVYRPQGSFVKSVLSKEGENVLSKALTFLQSAALAQELKKGEGLRDGESRVILSP